MRGPVTSSTSPTGRALLALELVQSNPGITADRLAARLGVTERAARRYVAILREADIPIESIRGRYGGYRVGRGLRLPPLVFSSDEALGLVMAALDGHHDVNDPTYAVGSAFAKIMRALPRPVAAQAQVLRQSAAPAPDRGAARPDPTITSGLVHACADHRRARIGYRSEAGSAWTAEVEPWAVVVRHGRWYLLCHSSTADAVRAYRVDRVTAVEPLDSRFAPPSDLDAVSMLERHLATGWEYDVDVVVDAPAGQVSRWLPPALGTVCAEGDGSRLRASTSDPAWYALQLARVPVTYHIAGGPELREASAEIAARMHAAAGGDG